MSHVLGRAALAGAMLWAAVALASAQQQTTTKTETKTFEVITVDGNDLVVKLPEGTRELTVPEDFQFTVDGQQMSVHELKPGMKGTATITTKTTLHPVTVTEVKNGTVAQVSGSTIIVRTDEGFKSFTQGELDKRGVKIIKEGKPAQVSDFHAGDQLTATIVTTRPPRAVTEREVNATLARTAAPTPSATSGSSAAAPVPARRSSTSAASASATSAPGSPEAAAPAARKLPKTASPLPVVGLIGIVSIGLGLALTIRRRRFVR